MQLVGHSGIRPTYYEAVVCLLLLSLVTSSVAVDPVRARTDPADEWDERVHSHSPQVLATRPAEDAKDPHHGLTRARGQQNREQIRAQIREQIIAPVRKEEALSVEHGDPDQLHKRYAAPAVIQKIAYIFRLAAFGPQHTNS